jgi:hypothetical protein
MPYQNTSAEIRPELTSILEEAMAIDTFLIGLDILPVFQVERKSGEWRKLTLDTAALAKAGDAVRAPKTAYKEVDFTWTKDSYAVTDRGLKQTIDDSVGNDVAHVFDLESQAAKNLLRRVRLSLEQRIKAAIFNTSNFDSANALVAYTAANIATIDFVEDVKARLNALRMRGEYPNTMVISRKVYDRVRKADLTAKFFFGALGGGKNVTIALLEEEFGLKIKIADAVVDTAGEGLPAVMSYIWTTDYIWIGDVQGGDITNGASGGAGRMVVWAGDTGGSTFVTETYRDEDKRSDVVRVRSNMDEKIVSSKAGTLIVTNWTD